MYTAGKGSLATSSALLDDSAVSMLHKAFFRNAIDASALIVVMMMSEHGDLGGWHA